MRKRLFQGMLLTGVIVLAAAGCAKNEKPLTPAQPQETAVSTPITPEQTPVPTQEPTPEPTPEMKRKAVKLYYTDSEITKLIEKDAEITYAKDEDVYAAALEALKESDDTSLVSLFKDITFKVSGDVKEKGELKVDLIFGPDAQLGSMGESYFLQAIHKTVFQFPEVKSLYITKDGQQVESLMGHVDFPYPIKRVD
ncbi:GerMN domain-containing protein [Paenibacillus eucommiae]|uniref:GerMN domain-containing protein n=1 Tax=Paenibacillus eucommiae TaxID=1355755 RepID=A0ABS4J4M7_9BACL|nr:GerMN domain-containing protein [Paenibacillus eucommiae]MBP1994797.1 hypothetical protein [Paenibacillus eucommiae]